MIILDNDCVDAVEHYGARIRCFEQVIAENFQHFDVMRLGEVKLDNGIDFVVEYVQRLHMRESIEGILTYHT